MTKPNDAHQKAKQRTKRLGDALKANLKKRRTQSRARDATENDAPRVGLSREDVPGSGPTGPRDRD